MFTQSFDELSIKTNGNKLIKITEKIVNFVDRSKISSGILNISILHTSASLIIQENADDDVQKDILNFYDKLVPMNEDLYIHNTEARIGREGIRFLIQRKTGQVATVKMTAQSKGPKKGRRMFKQANPKKTSATPTAIR